MTGPLFLAPGEACPKCRENQERAETYRARMKATDRTNARLLEQIAQLKSELDIERI